MTTIPEINELDTAKKMIETVEKELEKATASARYLAADFDTFRRRAEKERQEWGEMVAMKMASDLLDVIDNFERALADVQNKPELAPYISGFELTYQAFKKFLTKYGLEEIKEVTFFNPELHEAIMRVEDPSKSSGEIVTVFQKGYMYKTHVLRAAKVSVAA